MTLATSPVASVSIRFFNAPSLSVASAASSACSGWKTALRSHSQSPAIAPSAVAAKPQCRLALHASGASSPAANSAPSATSDPSATVERRR
jgi:hypothetical protein